MRPRINDEARHPTTWRDHGLPLDRRHPNNVLDGGDALPALEIFCRDLAAPEGALFLEKPIASRHELESFPDAATLLR